MLRKCLNLKKYLLTDRIYIIYGCNCTFRENLSYIKGVLTKSIVLNDFASKIREVLDMNKVSLLEENIDER